MKTNGGSHSKGTNCRVTRYWLGWLWKKRSSSSNVCHRDYTCSSATMIWSVRLVQIRYLQFDRNFYTHFRKAPRTPLDQCWKLIFFSKSDWLLIGIGIGALVMGVVFCSICCFYLHKRRQFKLSMLRIRDLERQLEDQDDALRQQAINVVKFELKKLNSIRINQC